MQSIGSALVILLVGSSASADATPTDRVVVEIVTANGSGCPLGTAWPMVSPDNTELHITYGNYIAAVGVGAGPVDFRKNCQLNVHVHAPPGFTYAIAAVRPRGFASLAAGATATMRARHSFQGQPRPPLIDHPLAGPFVDEWRFTDTVDPTALAFAACDAQSNLLIDTELRVAVGTSDPATTTSFIAMDTEDAGNVATIYQLVWRRCD